MTGVNGILDTDNEEHQVDHIIIEEKVTQGTNISMIKTEKSKRNKDIILPP